ncbi:MAG: NUDIX domain-containing protein [bacterium]
MTKRVFTQTFCAVGAIIERDGKILLVQENITYTPNHPDHLKWNQPAGWLDVGENPIDAAAREVLEETGLEFKPTALIGIYSLVKENLTHFYGDTPHVIKLIFRGEVVGGKERPQEGEIAALNWFTPDEIYAMGPEALRDVDIKQEVKDYLAGKAIPLSTLNHTANP